jgi:opacity protein-like surface antigen
MTGVAYKLDEASKINVGYRYFSMPDYEYDTHSVEVGYRYSF